jgi:hypothetical protein
MNKMVCESNFSPSPFVGHLQTLLEEFEKRFQQFTAIEPVVTSFVNPFTCQIEVTETAASIGRLIQTRAEELELEILDLKNDVVLKSYATHENIWNLVDREKLHSLRCAAYKITSYFGFTYICESLFSTMNIIKSKHRSRLADANLADCLRAGTSSYTPKFKTLADEMQCQRSH